MNTDNIERYLESFGKQVVKESRGLLQKEKGSTSLGNSIRFTVTKEEGGFSTKFYMEDYGQFLDKGVSGNKKKQSYKVNFLQQKIKQIESDLGYLVDLFDNDNADLEVCDSTIVTDYFESKMD